MSIYIYKARTVKKTACTDSTISTGRFAYHSSATIVLSASPPNPSCTVVLVPSEKKNELSSSSSLN